MIFLKSRNVAGKIRGIDNQQQVYFSILQNNLEAFINMQVKKYR